MFVGENVKRVDGGMHSVNRSAFDGTAPVAGVEVVAAPGT